MKENLGISPLYEEAPKQAIVDSLLIFRKLLQLNQKLSKKLEDPIKGSKQHNNKIHKLTMN